MHTQPHDDLIARTAALIRPWRTPDGRLHGDVCAVVVSADGRIYEGICVDTPSWGLCAERSALAAMITQGQYRARTVVAVWRDPGSQALHVLPALRGVSRIPAPDRHRQSRHRDRIGARAVRAVATSAAASRLAIPD